MDPNNPNNLPPNNQPASPVPTNDPAPLEQPSQPAQPVQPPSPVPSLEQQPVSTPQSFEQQPVQSQPVVPTAASSPQPIQPVTPSADPVQSAPQTFPAQTAPEQASFAATPTPPAGSGSGSKTLWIVIGAVVAGLILLGIAAAVVFGMMGGGAKNDSATSGSTENDTERPKSIVAEFSSELREVCNKTAISNTADYDGPSSMVAVAQYRNESNASEDSWYSLSLPYDYKYGLKDIDEFETVNAVACADGKAASTPAPKTCEYDEDTVKYIAVEYTVTLFESKTLKQIGESSKFIQDNQECPTFISYDKTSKEAYASPDSKTMSTVIDTIVK
jgi:hypothetical protein